MRSLILFSLGEIPARFVLAMELEEEVLGKTGGVITIQ